MSSPVSTLEQPDVVEHGRLVDALCARLGEIRAGLVTMYGTGDTANLEPVKAYIAIAGKIIELVPALRDWYPLHAAGQDAKLIAALRSLATEFRKQAAKTPGSGKLAQTLTGAADAIDVHVATLTKTHTAYLLANQSKAADAMPTWFATHLPKIRPMEAYLVLNQIGKERAPIHFGNFVERIASERKEAKIDLTALGSRLEKTIRSSKCLGKYPSALKTDVIGGSLRIYPDAEFVAAYVGDFETTNAQVIREEGGEALSRVIPVSEVDNVDGFQSGKTIFLRPDSDMSTRVHEALHLMSRELTDSRWKARLGCVLEESAAEYICGLVCKEMDIAFKLDGYYNNVVLLQTIMKAGELTDQMIVDAYLGGRTKPVEEAIVRISGAAGLAILVKSKEKLCYDTYNSWVAQWNVVKKEAEPCIVS